MLHVAGLIHEQTSRIAARSTCSLRPQSGLLKIAECHAGGFLSDAQERVHSSARYCGKDNLNRHDFSQILNLLVSYQEFVRKTMRQLIPILILLVLVSNHVTGQEKESQEKQLSQAELMELTKPGPEHRELGKLVGEWSVAMTAGGQEMGKGTASAETILSGRFLVIDGQVPVGKQTSEYRFTIGFDRRNAEYEVTLMDNAGTYSVSARGSRSDDVIRMIGTDNDPFMKQMGIDKKFAFDLKIASQEEFEITTIYVDNRTEEEKFIPAFSYRFKRKERP